MHPDNPILIRQTSDERLNGTRVRQVLEDGDRQFLHVPVGVLQGREQRRHRRHTDLPQGRGCGIPDGPILIMERFHERTHRAGVTKLSQQSRRILPQGPVLILQRCYLFQYPITHMLD